MGSTPIKQAKKCEKCGVAKPVDGFYKNESATDGRQRWCKDCQKAYVRKRKRVAREQKERVHELVARRPRGGRPTKIETETQDELAMTILRLRLEEGLSRREIARQLGMPLRTVAEYIARAKRLSFDSDSREHVRHWLMFQFEELHELALDAGNLTEARLTLEAMGRHYGFTSTGGNTLNVGVVAKSGDLEQRVEEWLAKQEAVEGELVGDDAAKG